MTKIGAMPRPCKLDTVQFRRKLTPAQRAVILAAGAGDMTRGFHELLDFYARAHNEGYRPGLVTNGSVKEDRSDAG